MPPVLSYCSPSSWNDRGCHIYISMKNAMGDTSEWGSCTVINVTNNTRWSSPPLSLCVALAWCWYWGIHMCWSNNSTHIVYVLFLFCYKVNIYSSSETHSVVCLLSVKEKNKQTNKNIHKQKLHWGKTVTVLHCPEKDLCQQIYNLTNIYISGKINNTKSDFRNP